MDKNYRRAKILFIDDEPGAVKDFVAQLRDEGYSNTTHMASVKSLKDVAEEQADLVFLDIAGVASALDSTDEGVAVLKYLRRRVPWTRVVVLSGSSFPVDRASEFAQADLCIRKATLSLAELVEVTESQLKIALAPEYRNALVLRILSEDIESLELGWLRKRKLKSLIKQGLSNQGDASFDWQKLLSQINPILSATKSAGQIIHLLVS